MAHSAELIGTILDIVKKTYPDGDGYEYLIEKSMNGIKPRMAPDIQVVKGNEVICAVEIGYTRPEKLTVYKNRGIKDVRWYDKEGNPHTKYDVVEKIVTKKYVPHKDETFMYAFIRGISSTSVSMFILKDHESGCEECPTKEEGDCTGEGDVKIECEIGYLSEYGDCVSAHVFFNDLRGVVILFDDNEGESYVINTNDFLEYEGTYELKDLIRIHEKDKYKYRAHTYDGKILLNDEQLDEMCFYKRTFHKYIFTFTEILEHCEQWFDIEIDYDSIIDFP